MTREKLLQKMIERGYTPAKLSELSGVPMDKLETYLSDETHFPGYDVAHALEEVLGMPSRVMEEMGYEANYEHYQGNFTVDDYRSLPDDERYELIDGNLIVMDAPGYLHQKIVAEIYRQIANFIIENDGDCEPLLSPMDIQLDCDEWTMVQPDVAILCKKDKVRKWGIFGAPDFVLEVISPSSRKKDMKLKRDKYENAGVREYWVLDPYKQKLVVHDFEGDPTQKIYGLDQPVQVNIYGGRLVIQMDRIGIWARESDGTGLQAETSLLKEINS